MILKKQIQLFLLLTIIYFNLQGQIINPSFSSRGSSSLEITKIEKNSYNTIVYFIHTDPYTKGGWACAGAEFFIRDFYSKKKYKLLKANNIPTCPQRHLSKYQGEKIGRASCRERV